MDKDKWNKNFQQMKEQLNFLKMEEDEEDDLEVEERTLSSGDEVKIDLPEGNLKEKLEQNRKRRFRTRAAILALVVIVIGGFVLYNQLHTFNDYIITESIENVVSPGTKYEAIGKYIYRYNSDGVSCVSRNNELKWSITYNMQAPIVDVCGKTMVIAEQQGNQVYVVNEEGQVGSFETLLPILKVRVSKQGVVAVVLEDDNVTWINLYKSDGTAIASDKTTVAESGYPLDMDLSPDGEKLAVSYLGIEEGIMQTDIVFYHFGSAGKSENDYVVSRTTYQEEVMPEIYFTGNACAVAVSDSGFVVFKGSDEPKQSATVSFDQEIVSCFHDDDRIGFLFADTTGEADYRMEIYNYRGKRKAKRLVNADFDEVKMQDGQILMFSEKECHVFTSSGRKRFDSPYEKAVQDIFYFSSFRKYLVITNDSFDWIRIS